MHCNELALGLLFLKCSPFLLFVLLMLWGFPGYRCLVDEYVFMGVVTIYEAVSAFHAEPFNGSENLFSLAV